MPFKSEAQKAFLKKNKPKLFEEFDRATPKDVKLPERIGVKKENAIQKVSKPSQTKSRGVF